MAGQLEAGLLQGGDHVGAAPHHAGFDPLQEVVTDQFARAGFVLEPGPQLHRLQVGAMTGLVRPRARRVVRAAPSVLMVEGVAQRVEGLLPAGRCDVQAAARLQVAPGSEDVDVDSVAVLPVQDRRPCVAVRLQSRPRRPLELVEDGPDLRLGRAVVGRPRDYTRGVLLLEAQRVGEGGNMVRVAAQDLDARTHPSGGIAFADEIVGRGAGGAGASRGEANVHRHCLRRDGRMRATNARTRRGWRSP